MNSAMTRSVRVKGRQAALADRTCLPAREVLARSSTRLAVSQGEADGCMAWMMRKPSGATLTGPRCCFCRGIGLLVRHAWASGRQLLLTRRAIV
jgi:hypothetical protein